MPRTTYVQDPDTGELIPKDQYVPKHSLSEHHLIIGDSHYNYDGAVATDGTDISTRAKHRAYMKANNLTPMDDFKDTWAKARSDRDAYFTTGKGGATSRDDVARAVDSLMRSNSNRR
jgi:hypothetical protein